GCRKRRNSCGSPWSSTPTTRNRTTVSALSTRRKARSRRPSRSTTRFSRAPRSVTGTVPRSPPRWRRWARRRRTPADRGGANPHRAFDLREVRLGLAQPGGACRPRLDLLMVADHGSRVLEDVAGQHRDHAIGLPDHTFTEQSPHAGHGGGAGGLASDPRAVHHRLGLENVIVADGGHDAVRLANR